MLRSFALVFLSLFVVSGDESCDRSEMENTICSLCSQRRGSELLEAGHQIAFFAYMTQNVQISSISKHMAFVYDRVETNHGNGYDVQSGNFTAPENGVYVFHTSSTSYDKSYCSVEVVKNGQIKDITFADSGQHDDRAMASSLTILSLTKGDIVHTRVGEARGGSHLESNRYTRMSFSGFKLA
uniref:C1q domain-containing protein n=1 Tax=Magallana gigas TaxID=29159 RepID=A0A8W8LQB1_MAGGI|nr:complement C1q-like protein 4 [Crassostrea gigas]